ncbi:G-protein coupled receptor Mth2-like [Hetaerina americana]|uniref:G-protein coupled receptor Mth2-like n=1 Tax=Hetaerina americana TaxID=62018 RepID=UPI003A7F4FE7
MAITSIRTFLTSLAIVHFVGSSLGQEDPTYVFPRILIDPPDFKRPCPKIREGFTSIFPGARNLSYSYLAIEDDPTDETAMLAIDGCPDKDPKGRPPLRKCCPMRASVGGEDGLCVVDHAPRRPFRPGVAYDNGSRWDVEPLEHFVFVFWRTCHSMLDPDRNQADSFLLRGSDGRLYLPYWNGSMLDPGNFCVDYVLERSSYLPFICDPNGSRSKGDGRLTAKSLYPIALLISTPFLFATFLVHACVRELRNIHGRNLMCLVGSYFISFLFLALGLLGLEEVSMKLCIASAFITEYAFLAAFFWLNIICFDIFLTFSGVCPLRDSSRSSGNKRFFFYSLYAWGVPFLILITSLVLEFTPGIPEYVIKPEFGERRCWFATEKALAVYFYGPIALVLFSNLIMFICTAVSFCRLKQETAMLRIDDDKKQRFNLYLKLFIIMGVNWIMEVIQAVVKGPDYLWVLCDLLNALQGVFIFFIFVWKKRVRGVASRKFCQMLPEKLSSGSKIFRSLNPWHRTGTNADPTHSETASRDHTFSTPIQSGATKESEELRTLTSNMK